MEVRDLIGGDTVTCDPAISMAEAARLMADAGIGSLIVVRSDRVVGIVTERDFVRAAAADASLGVEPVDAWMTPDPDLVDPDLDIYDAAIWMSASGYRHLPVMEEGRLLGVASIKDIVWALAEPRATTRRG